MDWNSRTFDLSRSGQSRPPPRPAATMLSDDEIQGAADQLAEYNRSNTLPQILEQYAALIEDYKRLKSDYEEERDARERYKQLARGQERNPFVLVLVDGDGYPFHENLLDKGADGGSTAAQRLNEAIKADLVRKGLDQCKIMIRIYANVAGLSKALSKAGHVGAEKRSLAPFIASFNRSYGLTEFVDAGELKENADFKLRALMHLYAENAQCKHIYLALSHDVGYISDLTPYMMREHNERFTLIKAAGTRFHTQFTKLGMEVQEFPGVFRQTPLEAAIPPRPAQTAFGAVKVDNLPVRTLSAENRAPPPTASSLQGVGGDDRQSAVCTFHARGKCKYGKACKNIHVERTKSSSSPWRARSVADAHSDTNTPPQELEDGILSTASNTNSAIFATTRDDSALAALLPKKQDIADGYIAVNKHNHRLDPYVAPADPETSSRLSLRIARNRVCNSFHLNGFCDAGDSCAYDHEPVDSKSKVALELLARSQSCRKRGSCRDAFCNNGHICQNPRCKHYGGKAHCKLPYACHTEELVADRFIPANVKTPHASIAYHTTYSSSAASNADEDGADGTDSIPAEAENDERDELQWRKARPST
ncbi:hypothetical protein EsH8_V_001150 [Colletotrichum jinshuiense]